MWQIETTEVAWDIGCHPAALQWAQAPRYRKHWFRNQQWKMHFFTDRAPKDDFVHVACTQTHTYTTLDQPPPTPCYTNFIKSLLEESDLE